jgi:hypothetical protein
VRNAGSCYRILMPLLQNIMNVALKSFCAFIVNRLKTAVRQRYRNVSILKLNTEAS